MSLLNVIRSFKTGEYTVRRRTEGSVNSDGLYVRNAENVFTIDASVQPVSGLNLKAESEGQHSEEDKILWTETELFTRDDTHDPDIVEDGGEDWEVYKVEAFGILDTFYRVTITRRDIP